MTTPNHPDAPRATPTDWLRRLTEAEARIALLTGLYLGRLALALIVTLMGLPVFPADRLLLVGVLLLITIFTSTVALNGDLKEGRVPSGGQLILAGLMDGVWLVLGYIVSGLSALPFPPLLVLLIGVNGVFLSAGSTITITAVATLLFGAASMLQPASSVVRISGELQAALFMGVGLISALVGNRLRAAGQTVQTLSSTVDQISTHFGELLEALPVGVVTVGPDANVIDANAHALALLGLPVATEGRHRVLTELVQYDGEVLRAVNAVLAQQGSSAGFGGTSAAAIPSRGARTLAWQVVGRQVPDMDSVRLSALAAPSPQGATVDPAAGPAHKRVAVLVLSDVTEAHTRAEMARRTEKYGAAAALSGGLAHEVRNPIAALRSAAEQLGERGFLDATDRRLVQIVLTESDRLNGLVTAFLEFSKVGGGDVGTHTMARIVKDAINTAVSALPKKKVVNVNLSCPPIVARTDADLVYRVVSNLMLNAVHFTEHDGTVDVKCAYDTTSHRVTISVRDYGPGVTPELRSRIFTPFFTARPGGSGLGLAVAERSAALLGGALTCDAVPSVPSDPRGALFTFTFPVDPAPVPDTPATGQSLQATVQAMAAANAAPLAPGVVASGPSAPSGS